MSEVYFGEVAGPRHVVATEARALVLCALCVLCGNQRRTLVAEQA